MFLRYNNLNHFLFLCFKCHSEKVIGNLAGSTSAATATATLGKRLYSFLFRQDWYCGSVTHIVETGTDVIQLWAEVTGTN